MIEDRGNAVGAMRSSTSFGMLMRSSASLASSPLSIVTAVQRRPASLRRHRREHMRADRLVRIADRDRNLDGRIEHLASVRPRLMRVPPHVELLRRAADVDRDRLERELCLVRRFGGVGLPVRGLLGGIRCFGCGIELRRRIGFGGVEFRARFGGLGSGLELPFLGTRLGLVRLCGGECLFGVSELGVGRGLQPFQLAQRRLDDAASRAAVAADFFVSSAALAASAASRASVSARAGAAATASAFGTSSAA